MNEDPLVRLTPGERCRLEAMRSRPGPDLRKGLTTEDLDNLAKLMWEAGRPGPWSDPEFWLPWQDRAARWMTLGWLRNGQAHTARVTAALAGARPAPPKGVYVSVKTDGRVSTACPEDPNWTREHARALRAHLENEQRRIRAFRGQSAARAASLCVKYPPDPRVVG